LSLFFVVVGQANYIGDGLVDEEAFSSAAHKGEVVHSTREQAAKAQLQATKDSGAGSQSSAAVGRYVCWA
jgi:hypothetical protein